VDRYLLCAFFGIRSLVVATPHSAALHKATTGEREYFVKSRDLKARMVEVDGGFVVRAGSEAALQTSKLLHCHG
jgi:hypothetical protein